MFINLPLKIYLMAVIIISSGLIAACGPSRAAGIPATIVVTQESKNQSEPSTTTELTASPATTEVAQASETQPELSPTTTETTAPVAKAIPADSLMINEDPPRQALFNINTLAYALPGMNEVEVFNFTYAHLGEKPLTMDVYYPPGIEPDAQLPVVVFGLGYRMSMEALRNSHQYTSWGKLVAAAGMAAITYDTEQPDQDLEILMAFIQDNASALRIDPTQIGMISCSANVPTVMSYLMQERKEAVKFSIYYYGLSLTPDHEYTEEFDQICEQRGCLVKELADVAYVDPELPLYIVKAGQDAIPHINEGMDHFLEYVQAEGAPVSVINFEEGRHGFDTMTTDESAEIVADTVRFMLESFGLE